MDSRAIKRLYRTVDLGFQRMETLRRARYKFIAQYVGPFYSKSKTASADQEEKKASPINLMYNAVTTLVPNLVYNEPKVRIGTDILPYRSYATSWESATNHLSKKIDLRMTLRKCITDSMFLAGFIKTGLAVSGQTLNLDGNLHNLGAPFADRVDPDDMLIDPLARDWDEQQIIGNRFRMTKDEILELGIYPADKVEKLHSRYDYSGKFKTEASSLSTDMIAVEQASIAEYVDLVEVYKPREQIIITVPYGSERGDEDILRIVEYDGPAKGPYHMLGYAFVPDNVLPVPPASIWYYLHILTNRIARKISRQAERMKRILVYEGGAVEDAQEIVDADDGESKRVDNVDKVKEVSYGGTTEDAYKYMEWVQEEFSKQAGNIDLLGGTSADQPTATQSEMLQSNNHIRLADQQNIVYTFTADVMADLAYFLHTDPLIDLQTTKRMNGADVEIRYTPEMREGDFTDYAFKVIPYSMARQDPNVRLQRILQFMSSALPAMAAAYQQLGPAFNLEGAMNLVLREMGIDEGDELINSQILQQQMMQMIQQYGQPDGKLGQQMGLGAPMGGGMPMAANGPAQGGAAPVAPGGGRPQQPNPNQRGPDGGVMPDTMKRQRQQATGGAMQATYTAR